MAGSGWPASRGRNELREQTKSESGYRVSGSKGEKQRGGRRRGKGENERRSSRIEQSQRLDASAAQTKQSKANKEIEPIQGKPFELDKRAKHSRALSIRFHPSALRLLFSGSFYQRQVCQQALRAASLLALLKRDGRRPHPAGHSPRWHTVDGKSSTVCEWLCKCVPRSRAL